MVVYGRTTVILASLIALIGHVGDVGILEHGGKDENEAGWKGLIFDLVDVG